MAHVAFILPNMAGGGAERVTLTLIREFLDRGHSVELVLMRKSGELLELVPEEVRIVDLNAARMRDAFFPLLRYFRRERLDAVHVALWPLTAIAIAAHRLARSKSRIIVSEHVALSQQYRASRSTTAAIRATTRFLFPLADARICVSRGSAEDLATLSRLPLKSISVVHNPIAPPPDPLPRDPAVEQLWDGAEIRILTVGSLKSQKNHHLLLQAFATLPQKSARLMIVGEGALRRDLEAQADKLGIRHRVIMPGFSSDPWPFYASATLFVLSSDYEGFGNVLLEAMMAGLKIVSTDCPAGPAEILDHGRFGRLVPCGNAKALARAMNDALSEPYDPAPARAYAETLSGPLAAQTYLRLMLG